MIDEKEIDYCSLIPGCSIQIQVIRMHYISILSTFISFLFAVAVLQRYLTKGGPHLLFWGIGLVFYGLGTLTEVLLGFSYHPLVLKIWYLSGAMLTAAWLGQGTVYLLVRKAGVANFLSILLLVLSLFALELTLSAPLTGRVYDLSLPVSTQYKQIMIRTAPIILMTILLNIYGTIMLVGGAIYSGFLFWRKKVLLNRVLGNLLIAGGALMPAMAGSLVKAGLVDWLYVSELAGVILMYVGFLQATSRQPAERRTAAVPSVR